jgi:hypothetical protein
MILTDAPSNEGSEDRFAEMMTAGAEDIAAMVWIAPERSQFAGSQQIPRSSSPCCAWLRAARNDKNREGEKENERHTLNPVPLTLARSCSAD